MAWRLVGEVVPRARWDEAVALRAAELAARSGRPVGATGIELTPLDKTRTDEEISYSQVRARLDRAREVVEITVSGPDVDAPAGLDAVHPTTATGKVRRVELRGMAATVLLPGDSCRAMVERASPLTGGEHPLGLTR